MSDQARKFVIKHENGTYFQRIVEIGPMFGGTKEQAMKFSNEHDANAYGAGDWKFMGTEVEEIS